MEEIPAPKKFSLPVLIAVVVVVLAILGAVAWLAFRNTGTKKTTAQSTPKVSQQAVKPNSKLAPASASTASNCLGVVKGNTLTILYRPTGPVPTCEQVKSDQDLVIINSTSQTQNVSFAGKSFAIQAHKDYQLNKQFGTYLSKGVHDMTFSGGGTAQIWEQ